MKHIPIILLFAALLFGGCEHKGSEHENEEGTVFLVTSPLQKDTVTQREYVCQIQAINHIELRAQEHGYLQNIFIDEGQFVRKGQRLFQIMPLLYRAKLQKALAEARYAEQEYKNAKMLADSNIISQNQLALIRAKYEKALAEVQLEKVHLQFTNITAPFDGIIGRLHVRVGSLLEEGELLTTLSDISKMWVYFNIPETEYLEYMRHHKEDPIVYVGLRMANGEIYPYPGKITAIESDFNNETGNIAFRATFPNPEKLLRHGETGNIIVKNPIKNAIIIPQKATFELLEKTYVFVVDKQGKVRQKEIHVLSELPHIFIVSGITPKDKILLSGLRKVQDGQKIEYKFLPPEKVLANLDLYAE